MEEIILNGIINDQQKVIQDIHQLKECLELRLVYIKSNSALKDEYQRNEDEITRIKTEIQLKELTNKINANWKELNENFIIYIQELEEQDASKQLKAQ